MTAKTRAKARAETSRLRLILACGAMVVFAPVRAQAAPASRFDRTLEGDVLIIGSAQGYDCGAGVAAPAGTTVACPGLGDGDSALDAYWVDNAAGGNAATAARTSAHLALPAGATVVRAQLYWGGLVAGTQGDATVRIDRAEGLSADVGNAEVQEVTFPSGLGSATAYQATADVTALVQALGAGAYRVTDIDARANNILGPDDLLFAGWVLVVAYQQTGAPERRITLYDGLTAIAPGSDTEVTLRGLDLSGSGVPAGALGVWAFEGDRGEDGDRVTIDDAMLADTALNPSNNLFNGTRSHLGVAQAALVPPLSGNVNSLPGVDVDLLDISSHLRADTTEIEIGASTLGDTYWLGGFVTSVGLAPPPPDGGADAGGEADAGAPDLGDPDRGPPDAEGLDGSEDAAVDAPQADARPDGGGADAPEDGGPIGSLRTVLGGSGCACRVGERGGEPGASLWLGLCAVAFALSARAARARRRSGRGL